MHIHQASSEQHQLVLGNTLALRHPPQSQGLGLSVMENRPTFMDAEIAIKPFPAALFTVLGQHQQRLIASSGQIPGSISSAGESPEAMEKIMAGIGV